MLCIEAKFTVILMEETELGKTNFEMLVILYGKSERYWKKTSNSYSYN